MSHILVERVRPYDHIIWDFNGTLLDDVGVAVAVLNKILKQCKVQNLTVDRYREVFRFPVKEYMCDIGVDFNQHCFDELSNMFHKTYGAMISDVKLFEGMKDALEIIGEHKHQSILSAAPQGDLEDMLVHFEIDHHFTHVYGLDNLYAHSKVERGRELMEVAHVSAEKTILVGDTDHDLEVGQELGCAVLLVADGYQSYERLSAKHNNVIKSRYA